MVVTKYIRRKFHDKRVEVFSDEKNINSVSFVLKIRPADEVKL
jgi:hypothetical protein